MGCDPALLRSRGQCPGVLAGFTSDVAWRAPESVFGEIATADGPEAVGAFFAVLPKKFKELQVEPSGFMAADDVVVVVGHHVGSGDNGSFDADFVHVWTLEGDKVSNFHEVADTALITAAL